MESTVGSYFFYVEIEGFNLMTQGFCFEWNPKVEYITDVGLMTRGLIAGKNDFWQPAEVDANPNWTISDI